MSKNKIVCEKQIKEKKIKERFRNQYTIQNLSIMYRTNELYFYEIEYSQNEKDGHYRRGLKVMQEKKKYEADLIELRYLDLNVKLRNGRMRFLPDSRDGVKSLFHEKNWKHNSKRRKQWC